MQIYVNEQELDAELTGERNLAEIYKAVSEWIAGHNRYILSMRVDSQDVALSGLNDIGMTDVDRVDFYVGDELDMVLTTLGELDRYVDQIGTTLYECDTIAEKDILNLNEGMQWIRQILASFSAIINLDLSSMSVLVPGSSGSEAIDRILERLDKRVQSFAHQNGREAIEDFLEDLRSFKFFVMKLELQLRTMNARTEELVGLVERFDSEIPELTKSIVSINESFNSGKDFTALEVLDRITERLNEYVSALFALDYQLRRNDAKAGKTGDSLKDIQIGDVSFHTVATDLTSMLKDLSGALEENDIVAAGDILEYELTEKLGLLQPYLTEIRQLVLASEA